MDYRKPAKSIIKKKQKKTKNIFKISAATAAAAAIHSFSLHHTLNGKK